MKKTIGLFSGCILALSGITHLHHALAIPPPLVTPTSKPSEKPSPSATIQPKPSAKPSITPSATPSASPSPSSSPSLAPQPSATPKPSPKPTFTPPTPLPSPIIPPSPTPNSEIPFVFIRQQPNGGGDILKAKANGNSFTSITNDGLNKYHLQPSPNKDYFLYNALPTSQSTQLQAFLILADGTQKKQITQKLNPIYAGMKWSQDGKALVYNQQKSGQQGDILVYDLTNGRTDTFIENRYAPISGETPQFVLGDTHILYPAGGSLYLREIESNKETFIEIITAGNTPMVSPDQKRIAYQKDAYLYPRELYVRNLNALQDPPMLACKGYSGQPFWHNNSLYCIRESEVIRVQWENEKPISKVWINFRTDEKIRRIKQIALGHNPQSGWTALMDDGELIWISSDLKTQKQWIQAGTIPTGDYSIFNMQWSPDDRTLLFNIYDSIYLVNREGWNFRKFTPDKVKDASAFWLK